MAILVAILLVLALVLCWLLNLLSLPGNWLMAVLAGLYAWLAPARWPAGIGWKTVVLLLVLAAIGEIVELAAGALGATKAGGSRRGAALALAGSVVGSIVGIFIGLPIPMVGSFVAAVLFAGLGAMAGAILGETWAGRDLGTSFQIGHLAFWGRLAGTLGKMLVGAAMIVVVVVALLW